MKNNANNFQFYEGTHLNYLLDAYNLLILSYYDLLSKGYNVNNCNENKIRDDVVKIAEKLPTILKYEWITESRDLGKVNRIDIDLITSLSLGKKEKRLKIECKIIGENSYVNRNGIDSFTEGKYSSEMFLAGMIGFIKDGNIKRKIKNIKNKINKHKTIKTTKNLTLYKIDKKFKYSYFSQHKRNKSLPKIDLYHLFFDFTTTSQH